MQITYINNDGSGFADKIEIAEGTTIEQLFSQRVSYGQPQDYLIRVNRQPTTADSVLQPGDRVSITPTKIEGAWFGSDFFQRKGTSWEPANGSTVCI